MYVCVRSHVTFCHMYVDTHTVCHCAYRGQKAASDPSEVELQAFVG